MCCARAWAEAPEPEATLAAGAGGGGVTRGRARVGRAPLVALGLLGLAWWPGWSAAAAAPVPARPSAGCAAVSLERGRRLERTIAVDGVPRSYVLDVPEGVRAGVPVPVLFDFHGFGHSAAGVWDVSRFRELGARDLFITVYPQGLPVRLLGREDAGWQIWAIPGNRDVAFVSRLLDHMEQRYCIDAARVFATGFSNGAFLTHLLGCAMAERIAAIAPVSGGRLTVPCRPTRGMPVLIHHGRADELVDVRQARAARDAWAAINGCGERRRDGCEWYGGCRAGAAVRYCESDAGHRWPLEATERIWKFFRDHPLPAAGEPPEAD